MSPGRSPVDWMESRKENLLVNDEGKLLLRCADAQRASSGISRGEMREKLRFFGNVRFDEEIATFGSWWTHGAPCGNEELPRIWRGAGALQMDRRHADVGEHHVPWSPEGL